MNGKRKNWNLLIWNKRKFKTNLKAVLQNSTCTSVFPHQPFRGIENAENVKKKLNLSFFQYLLPQLLRFVLAKLQTRKCCLNKLPI